MNTGQIRKSKVTERFTVIPNGILEDKALSLRAIGLLCYLLRLPDDWVINKTSLHKNLKEGRDAVLVAFKELEDAGYISVLEIREKGRFVGYDYELSNFPHFKKTPIPENPNEINGFKGQPIPENPKITLPIPENPESVFQVTAPPIPEKPKSDIPKSEKPKSDIPELLNTNSTKNEVNKELSNKNAPGGARKKSKAVNETDLFTSEDPKPGSQPAAPGLYKDFIEIYFKWFKEVNGVPPKMDAANGSAAKHLISYFRTLVEDKASDKKEILDELAKDSKILEGWNHLLKNWKKLDNYSQNKTRLLDINANIQNLITQIKNGNGTINGNHSGKNGQSTPGATFQQFATSLSAKFSGRENNGHQAGSI